MLDAKFNTENEVASMKMTFLGDVGVSVEAVPCVARLHHVRVLCGEHTETTWPPPAPLCPGQDAAPCPVSTHQPSSPRHPRRARDPRGHGRRARHPAPSPDPRLPPPLCPPTVPPPCAGVRWPAFTRRFVSVVSGVVVAGCSECANNSSKHPPAQNQFNCDDTRGVGVSLGLWKL